MAILSLDEKDSLKKQLLSLGDSWIVIGLQKQKNLAATMDGLAGLADWILHGQVSKQLQKMHLSNGDLLWVPGIGISTNFLFIFLDDSFEPKEVFKKLRAIKMNKVVVAENTFPEDFLGKLKQNLKKEEVTFTSLE